MMTYSLRYPDKHWKLLTRIFSPFSKTQKITLRYGLIMKLYGSLILKKFTKSWEMILTNGKLCSMKFVKIERHSITVKQKNILDRSSLTIVWF